MLGKSICSGWRPFLVLCLSFFIVFLHIMSVLELRQHSAEEVPQRKQYKKFDHLVFGPAAGEGLSDRLQCEGNKALTKTYFGASSKNLKAGSNIAIVTVFATYNTAVDQQTNGKSIDSVTVGNISYNKVERSIAVLNVFVNFIQETMPQSNIIILTNPSSKLPVERDRLTILPIQGDYSREMLMLQRIRSYIVFLETRAAEHSKWKSQVSHYIFTDSDIAVVDDLGQIFSDHPDFHVALTFRNNKVQPLNSGFIAVRGTPEGILRAKSFLEEVLKVYTSKFMKASRMLGDQLALAWVVKSHSSFDVRRFSRKQAFMDQISGASVLFLPCSIYNWTPPEGAGQFHGMPLDVKVVHFKGSRKRLMLESWNFLKSTSSSDIADMLCLILRSGRTKYDF
ncbi:hypothetical protein FXO38_22122 [Capsicum annuum]|uniref:Nucleotide-diphospho-sugar transferase n=1 Tax=Capsicum annuum TaxID=4072 RepID=A0A1U8EI95_CAPAN|nr:hypothetical protein FXO37_32780 [Capsicum annuum]KAF3640515.1 hypothetical protein FXO38_22122 [Capsicum annuum]PHT70576.1 hypothetical protein T459_25680 [Capsicum annuum]